MPSNNRLLAGLVFSITVGFSWPVLAIDGPIQTQNRSALVRLNGLPAPETGRLLQAGHSKLHLGLELTSQFVTDANATEQLLLDGETASIMLDWRYGLNEHWELGVSVPLLSQGGGFLDNFIESWHETFSLPNGQRETQPQNQLLYRLQNAQQTVVFSDANTGVGDIAIQLRRAVYNNKTTDVSAFGRIELPTGDAAKFTGSDSTDVALGINVSATDCLYGASCHATAGLVWYGDTAVYDAAARTSSVFATASLAMPVREHLMAKVQLEAHQAMYRSDIKALGQQALQLSFGGAYRLSSQWDFSLAMSEDISPGTAPDFSIVLGLSYQP